MDNKRKTIGHIGGIPFMVDNDADEKAFASMFPNGAELKNNDKPNDTNSNSNKQENFIEKSQRVSDEMMLNNPLGENSIFYKPVPKLTDHSIKES
jgi:hypothetical protein